MSGHSEERNSLAPPARAGVRRRILLFGFESIRNNKMLRFAQHDNIRASRGEAPLRPYEKHRAAILLALAILILLTLTNNASISPASAQTGGGYDLTWNTIDGGGAMFSVGGAYSLGGTIGQADAGTMSGGAYTLNGGFWVDFFGNKLMLPLILK